MSISQLNRQNDTPCDVEDLCPDLSRVYTDGTCQPATEGLLTSSKRIREALLNDQTKIDDDESPLMEAAPGRGSCEAFTMYGRAALAIAESLWQLGSITVKRYRGITAAQEGRIDALYQWVSRRSDEYEDPEKASCFRDYLRIASLTAQAENAKIGSEIATHAKECLQSCPETGESQYEDARKKNMEEWTAYATNSHEDWVHRSGTARDAREVFIRSFQKKYRQDLPIGVYGWSDFVPEKSKENVKSDDSTALLEVPTSPGSTSSSRGSRRSPSPIPGFVLETALLPCPNLCFPSRANSA
ncbi:hypothetical protein IAU59_002766 [Kwoniella sp. CBS 9459]